MNKLIIGAIGLTALTLTTAAATADKGCDYNPDGTFNIGKGQVALYGSWKEARACAMQGLLPDIVAERLGRYGDEQKQIEGAYLRVHNAKVKTQKKEREVEVQPLPPIK
mgnify:CR=1 FL=1|jgi:hypothetical protein|tara:strand:- start:58 stop:384 length:327 start_codon:yes stop_codon:yes gene_type:complete